ncbi:MAG TPA: purine nucleoside permease [Candidatus Binataceae bacterium]|nr:purine nucleoside permease [Candidatus Binataceae bacterium]
MIAGLATIGTEASASDLSGFPVKIMIISMFPREAQPWITNLRLDKEIAVPGLRTPDFAVHCNAEGVCNVIIGEGHANAAASIMALLLSRKFELTHTYFLIAGIAGVDPKRATVGSATRARYVVDFGLESEIDAREMPAGWESGYFALGSTGPGQPPKSKLRSYATEHYELNETLLQKILSLSSAVKLADSGAAQAYRARYPTPPANQPPKVIQCDTASGDTFWQGRLLGMHAEQWVALMTHGKGVYCTTEQEDNATMAALTRGAEAGLIDINRVAILRTASDFDRPYPGQSAYDSLIANSPPISLALENLYNAGVPWVNDVVANWPQWREGVPPIAAPAAGASPGK